MTMFNAGKSISHSRGVLNTCNKQNKYHIATVTSFVTERQVLVCCPVTIILMCDWLIYSL